MRPPLSERNPKPHGLLHRDIPNLENFQNLIKLGLRHELYHEVLKYERQFLSENAARVVDANGQSVTAKFLRSHFSLKR